MGNRISFPLLFFPLRVRQGSDDTENREKDEYSCDNCQNSLNHRKKKTEDNSDDIENASDKKGWSEDVGAKV